MRRLAPQDLDAVVAIDAALGGRTRRAYFERRLQSAQRDPERHVQLAADRDGKLAGFILGDALEGEFGRSEPALRLEALGVEPAAQGRGLGAALSGAFEAAARERGAGEIRTAALWREHGLLRFLDRAGYRLAASHVLDCALAGSGLTTADDDAEIALLDERDLEGVARVDRRHTGRDRRGYLCRAIREALSDSAVRISLAARVDGGVAGYLMARLDYGDFGRAEPVAVIDTVGVDPLRARQGIGHALLSQLFVNLRGLGVERVETVVAAGNLELMGFFYRAGFRPAERLAFLKRLP
ncbi:MAG TPA: GNAT family N-acetyltransferase [Burkholderiales bacterium]